MKEFTEEERKRLKDKGIDPEEVLNNDGKGAHRELKKIRRKLDKGDKK